MTWRERLSVSETIAVLGFLGAVLAGAWRWLLRPLVDGFVDRSARRGLDRELKQLQGLHEADLCRRLEDVETASEEQGTVITEIPRISAQLTAIDERLDRETTQLTENLATCLVEIRQLGEKVGELTGELRATRQQREDS